MKAFAVGRYGGKDGAQMREMPEPGIGEHDVLVAVRAASVNLLDAKIRDGEFKHILPYRVPFVLGNDLAGRVVRVGPAVRSFAPGDEVYARPGTDNIGTFAELAAIHEHDLALKPATLTMEESAALPLVALTAWQALVERADPAARPEHPHPRRVRWRRDDRDPARQAPRRARRNHDGHGQRRMGQEPRR
jgi:NADPH:quinone reductase-like Zn-dependent oxidoreductase